MRTLTRFLRQNPIGMLGGLIVLLFAFIALFPQAVVHADPVEMHLEASLMPPNHEYPLGTDRYGRDILSRIAYGTRISFQVGVLSVMVAAVMGSVLGLLAGYLRGWTDYLVMRVMDTLFAFPSILLAIAIVAVMGAGLTSIVLAIGIIYTPIFARVARAPTLSVKEREFVTAAITIGANTSRILLRHILPNVLAPILVQVALSLSGAIIVEAALSFLGLGALPPTPSLGSMLSEGREFMEVAPWTVLYPGLALALMIMGVNLFGDGVRDLLDPRMRGY
ncbi:MAG TPA: ABC transporter permease [Anaerolineae bacterium]|nr:ABC transporter permease [Anaerolineae bacterium]